MERRETLDIMNRERCELQVADGDGHSAGRECDWTKVYFQVLQQLTGDQLVGWSNLDGDYDLYS